MKIAIIGAGWIGCHLALKLKHDHEVVLYEEDEIFSKTSSKNQNRLHLGFHYARSSVTRNMCRQTFHRFLDEYGHLVSDIEKNIYAVPVNGSVIDFETYTKIFAGWEYEEADSSYMKNIESAIRVHEKHINPVKAKRFFEKELKGLVVHEKINEKSLKQLARTFDLIINCTNNELDSASNVVTELNTLLIYKKIRETEFDALTLVDGELFSIFPYLNDTYLVSHVKHSPDTFITDDERVELIEQDVLHYYPAFKEAFELVDVNKSYKSKVKISTDPRVPVISQSKNVINIFTGKIQGIFDIESYVKNVIRERGDK